MHTCAPHPRHQQQEHPGADLFGGVPPALLEFAGTLAAAPVIRTRSEQGRPVPVLCVELHGVGPRGNTVHAELPFAEEERRATEACAAALQPGQRVIVTTAANTLRLNLPRALSVAPAAE
ncbi:hypothetical protein [Melaminivora sp.]|uniref:hypothetical protein n=1 Tax=Melaminivora sp. TaxID=1933032 RepID=UPI0028AEFD06|nr:hypothetical protein [Melaminivora sp.]